uniref:Uncharacterized protein n=1 Tax=Asparagus officinalis TaxID=4686 RepID=Q2AA28_ASPOF|nr:hypothetical protein 20.t00043 [Asparagus officinalis]
MATIVGETVSSTEMVVGQFDEVVVETTVESLIIEFDQAKYKEYLSTSSSNGNASRKCHRVVRVTRPQVAEASMPEDSTRAMAGGSISPKLVNAKQNTKSTERKTARWAFARSEAQAFASYDGLNYYSGLKNAKWGYNPLNAGDFTKTGEPPRQGELHSSYSVSRFGELSTSGEPGYLGEPTNSDGLHFLGHISDSSRLPKLGEFARAGEPMKIGEPHRVRLTYKHHMRTNLNNKGKTAGKFVGIRHPAVSPSILKKVHSNLSHTLTCQTRLTLRDVTRNPWEISGIILPANAPCTRRILNATARGLSKQYLPTASV